MRKSKVDLLKEIMFIPSPSGFEDNLINYIYNHLKNYLPKKNLIKDSQNNLIAKIDGKIKKSIMYEAHLDEIGFIVTNVDRYGFISLKYIGGGDSQILTARHLNILTKKGTVNAVINRMHSHLVVDEDTEKIDNISEAQIDIGIRGRKQVLRQVRIGDPVVYTPSFNKLAEDRNQGQFVSGYGFDDKSGCFILIETIKEILKTRRKPHNTLYFVFSAREEIGNPPKKIIRELKPSLYVGVDVTFATDYADDNLEREVGKCELGKGITLYRGVNIHQDTVDLLSKIARQNKIKIQYQASTGDMGYNATSITDLVDKTVIVAPPVRCMHTCVETINLKDLEYGIKLLKHLSLVKEI